MEIINQWQGRVIKIPRRVVMGQGNYQLHVFVDASKDAYACAVYVRAQKAEEVSVRLLYAKNRLRPKATAITIPRMELLGVVIGTRALTFVNAQLRLPTACNTVWCDNKAVLA
jgi:hypothetical protein